MSDDTLLEQARTALRRGETVRVRQLANELVEREPRNVEAWLLAAQTASSPTRAEECYERVLSLQPGNLEAKRALVKFRFPGQTFDPRRGIVPDEPRLRPAFKLGLNLTLSLAAAAVLLSAGGLALANGAPAARALAPLRQALGLPSPIPAAAQPPAENATLQSPPAALGPTAAARAAELDPQQQALVSALLAFAGLATSGGMDGAPPAPGPAITAPAEGAAAVRQALRAAVPEPGAQSSLTLTEAELTAWLRKEMAATPDLPVYQAQVFLRDGKVQLFGYLTANGQETSALVVGGARITPAGGLEFFLDSAQVGRWQLPGPLADQGLSWLNQRFAEEMARQAPGLRFTDLTVADGQVTLSGAR